MIGLYISALFLSLLKLTLIYLFVVCFTSFRCFIYFYMWN